MVDGLLFTEPSCMATAVDSGEAVVVGIAEAISVAERLRPPVTVLEMGIPVPQGFHVAQTLIDRKLTRAVVIHTADVNDIVALASIIAGVSAVVPQGSLREELDEVIRGAARGGIVRPRVTIDGLVEAAATVDPDDIPILGMLVHGTSPAGIGEVLGVHERELAGRRRRMLNALLGEAR
jgi:DNA-binding NarL/FixJ family response regulator